MSLQRIRTLHYPLLALLATVLPTTAAAKAGLVLSGDSQVSTYDYPAGEAEVRWTRITLMPWWRSGPWELKAEIPWLMRDASSEGTVNAIRHQNGNWSAATLTGSFEESDKGVGDIYTSASYSLTVPGKQWLRPYFVTELKLPTGDENAVEYYFDVSFANSARSNSAISFGNGSTDLRVGPGVEVRNSTGWLRGEASHIWSKDNNDIPVDNRLAAYAGIGYTPTAWLELTAAYNHEGALVDGGDNLNQATFSLLIRPPESSLVISISTYENEDSPGFSDNWSVGMSAGF